MTSVKQSMKKSKWVNHFYSHPMQSTKDFWKNYIKYTLSSHLCLEIQRL